MVSSAVRACKANFPQASSEDCVTTVSTISKRTPASPAFAARSTDGTLRHMLCLNVNFAFKAPVFAEQDVNLRWRVATAAWNRSLGGMLAHLDGQAWAVADTPAVIARGTILVSTVSA